MTLTTENMFAAEGGSVRIRVLTGVWYNRAGTMEHLAEGQECDVDAMFALSLCGDGRAVRVTPAAAKGKK